MCPAHTRRAGKLANNSAAELRNATPYHGEMNGQRQQHIHSPSQSKSQSQSQNVD